MKDWEILLKEINEWADETFGPGNRNTAGKARHMEEEAQELREIVEIRVAFDEEVARRKIGREIADIVIMCIHAAHGEGIDLYDAVREKFEIVKKREWLPPDENGVIRHVKKTA